MKPSFRNHIAYLLDALIAIGVIVGMVLMFTVGLGGTKATDLSLFKYFTVQSNVLMGLFCLVAFPFDLLLASKKKNAKPSWLSLLLLLASTGTTLTCLVVTVFLGPTMGYGMMYESGNLFLHLLVPLLALTRVIFFESASPLNNIRHTFFGIVHMGIYGIVYLSICIANNGYGKADYDWYGFGAGGPWMGVLSFFIVLLATYGITFLTFLAQRQFLKHIGD